MQKYDGMCSFKTSGLTWLWMYFPLRTYSQTIFRETGDYEREAQDDVSIFYCCH